MLLPFSFSNNMFSFSIPPLLLFPRSPSLLEIPSPKLSLHTLPKSGISFAFLLLFHLEQEGAVDMRQNAAKGNRRADECVELFVTADGELQMTGRNAFHFEILGCVPGQLEHFGGKIFEDGSHVDGGFGQT